MRHRPISAFLLCTAIALPFAATAKDDEATRHSHLLLAQADATDDNDPLAPFLKRTTPTPPDAAEEEATAEAEAEAEAEPKVDAPNVEEASTEESGIEDVPRKSMPKAAVEEETAEKEAVEEETKTAEPEVVTVRESTSMATISPNQLYEILSERVDQIEVDPTGGDTTLEGRLDGTPFQIYFYECDGGDMSSIAYPDSECLGYEWRSYFFDARPSTRAVNEWNASYHYGKLFIDRDGDLTVQLNVVVEGGIEERNILTTLAWFRAVLDGVKSEF